MILYGRDLSPFARRLALFCALQERAVERQPILVQGEDFERLKTMNPVGRVPVLKMDDGSMMAESYAIGDWLDETSPNGWRGLPASGEPRRRAYQRLAVASGTAEKAVALVYEKNRRPEEVQWPEWQARLAGQIRGGLAGIEAMLPNGWSGGDTPDAGDLAAVIAYQFCEATNPWLLEPGFAKLAAFTDRAMAEIPAVAATKPSL